MLLQHTTVFILPFAYPNTTGLMEIWKCISGNCLQRNLQHSKKGSLLRVLWQPSPMSPKELRPAVKALSLLPGQHLTSPSYLGNGHEWPREKNLSEGKGLHPAEQKKSPEESRRKHTTPSKGTQLEMLVNGTPQVSCPAQHTFLEARQ